MASPPIIIAGCQMIVAAISLCFIFPVWGPAVHAPVTSRHIIALVYLITIGGCLAFFCWAYLLSKVPVARAITYGYINPVVALLVGWLLLGEVFQAFHIAGMGLTVVGVTIVHLGKRPKPLPPSGASSERPEPRCVGCGEQNRTP
jgi:drug/metabolite transporter (DMT)-like permease